ncbi:MAG: GAF domain-containing sensor histidine kinase [Tardiphaga sp.]
MSENEYSDDIAAVQQIDAVPKILEIICQITGMGFAAVARVTDSKWICCAVRDEISFGLGPGGELELKSTICHEIRQHRQPVVIDDVANDPIYFNHHTPAKYGLQSYVSMPIFLKDGSFFGTLCAIDPHPRRVSTPTTVNTFKLFADLIGFHLSSADALAHSKADLVTERQNSELREQFIAVLGHDLRNPLASIAAVGRMLEKAGLNGKERGYLEMLQNSVNRMSSLIENVLDFARGRLGNGLTLTKTRQRIGPTITQVVNELKATAPNRDIQLDMDLKMPVRCDPVRIGQLLSNLLGNALAYGDSSQPIKVRATTSLQMLELSVANAGKVIPPAAMEKIFMPFARGAGQTGQEGLGLGLYIAFEIARAHDGVLTATSTPLETEFILRMPLG